MAKAPAQKTQRRGKSESQKKQSRLAALLVSPTIIVISIVILFPTISALYQSLFGAKGIDPETGFVNDTEPFVGLDNYINIFAGDTGARFWTAFWNTTFFAFVTVSIETVLGVIMALIMHQAIKARGFVRAAILVPWAIPTAISAVLWKWIFDAHGAANALLNTQILWATSEWPAKFAIIIADTWKTAPFIGLLTLAGLQIIPEEVYEAAKIDGANAWRRFLSITLPLVKPALVVAVLFRALDALRMFDLPYILIGPRKGSVETLSMLVQDEATNLRYGSGAAYAVILFLYVFLISFAFIKLLGAELFEDDGQSQKSSKLRLSAFFKRSKEAKEVQRPPSSTTGGADAPAQAGSTAEVSR